MSTSYWLDKSSNTFEEVDIAIVGAGIAGLSVAYWLEKEDPSLKIIILEKLELAGGATGRNAGFITCGSVEHFNRLVERWGPERAKEIWNFSEENLNLLKQEIIDNPEELEFDHNGSFSLASTDSEFGELKKTAQLMEQFGIGVEVLDEQNVIRRLGANNFVGGIRYLGDASVHPVKLCQKIFSRLNSTKIYFHTELHRYEMADDGNVELHTNTQNFKTGALIFATNGYSADLNSYFADKIYPTRGQILRTQPVKRFMEGPCYANFVLDYFRQLHDGSVLIGGFRQLEKATEVGYSDHITETIQNALYEFLQKHIPHLESKKVTHRWAGIMGFSADGQPLIGSLPNNQQIFFSAGFTAHGLGLAFHCGKALVDLMFQRPIPDFISARRF